MRGCLRGAVRPLREGLRGCLRGAVRPLRDPPRRRLEDVWEMV